MIIIIIMIIIFVSAIIGLQLDFLNKLLNDANVDN